MASRFADINSVEQFIEDQENENTRKKTQQNVEKSSLSQVSECSATTVHSTTSAADYQQCRSLPVLLFMVVNSTISISSLNQPPTLATPETEIKSTKKGTRLRFIVCLKAYVS